MTTTSQRTAAAVAVVGTTTTSHSDSGGTRRGQPRSLRLLITAVSVVLSIGCRKDAPEPEAAPELPPPVRPSRLMAEGVVRRPQATWMALRSVLGDAARVAPTTFQLAVAGALGLPPLSAGLIDPEAPITLALVNPPPSGDAHLVAGIPLTSGQELLAALTAGTSPPFASRGGGGLTLLTAAGRAASNPAIGVVGDRLVVSDAALALEVAGAYVGAGLEGLPREGPSLELSSPQVALSGPLVGWFRSAIGVARTDLERRDEEQRKLRGGRAPDFADPKAFLSLFSDAGESTARALGSARALHLRVHLDEGPFRVEVRLEPDASGFARDLAVSLPRGSTAELHALPGWFEAALLVHRSARGAAEKAADPPAPPLLGDRLDAAHRARLGAWVQNLDAGFGSEVVLGLFSREGDSGFVALGPSGQGEAMLRAVTELPKVLAIPAVAEPLATFFRDVRAGVPELSSGSSGPRVRLALRTERKGGSGETPPLVIVAGQKGQRAAVVVGSGGVEERLALVLEPRAATAGARTLGEDADVAGALQRAGADTMAALVFHGQAQSGPASAGALLVGSTRGDLWAELSGPGALSVIAAMVSAR